MLENLLINKCKAGDGDAYRRLMNNYKNKLFGYLWRFSNSQDVAEELFQLTLIKVWKGLKKYDDRKKFSSWLFTVAHNVAMDDLRMRKSSRIFTTIDEIENGNISERPDDEYVKKESIEIINKSVNDLSEKQKSVFLLRQNGELTFREIAEIMNEPLNTITSHMHYAIKKIKKQIEKENEPRKRSVI